MNTNQTTPQDDTTTTASTESSTDQTMNNDSNTNSSADTGAKTEERAAPGGSKDAEFSCTWTLTTKNVCKLVLGLMAYGGLVQLVAMGLAAVAALPVFIQAIAMLLAYFAIVLGAIFVVIPGVSTFVDTCAYAATATWNWTKSLFTKKVAKPVAAAAEAAAAA